MNQTGEWKNSFKGFLNMEISFSERNYPESGANPFTGRFSYNPSVFRRSLNAGLLGIGLLLA